MTEIDFERMGYIQPRKLPTGEWAAVEKMLFTWALVVGLDQTGYRTRFCYEHITDAGPALEEWNGEGDPPGPWIKEKPIDRLGPGATN